MQLPELEVQHRTPTRSTAKPRSFFDRVVPGSGRVYSFNTSNARAAAATPFRQ
jgi:hypothetical protein